MRKLKALKDTMKKVELMILNFVTQNIL